ncbi:hypothetical protein B0H13DRAFT_2439317 [Mycena leptocephala]|nr:hypothetical protein B0H13DRAFT_2439317 [Mycena leptocephala]
MTDIPEIISHAIDASNDEEINSRRHASADEWTLTEKYPLISPGKSPLDGEFPGDVKPPLEEYTQRFKWPLVVIIGQALVLALSWGFFAVVRARGQITLDAISGETLQHYPRTTTYAFTLVATGLATFSSYLLSQAVRHAIVVYLKEPIALSRLDFAISISQQSLIYELREFWWVLAAALFSFATIQQTSSWSTLLSPINIQAATPLVGTELDVTTDAFRNQFDQLWLNTSTLYPYIESSLLSIIDTSGATRANSAVGYPGVLGFADYTYWYSTGGTIPIFPEWSSNIVIGTLPPLITSNTKPLPAFYTSLNASMGQQGLTAAVSCQAQDLNAESDPPLSYWIEPANITLFNQTYTIFQVSTVCAGEPTYSVPAISVGNNTLSSVVCPNTYQPGTATYTMIIEGRGVYEARTLVCQVTPRIQNMITSYSNVDFSTYVYSTPDPNYPPSQGDAGGMGWAAVWGLNTAIQSGQSPWRSHVGDSITSIYTDQNIRRPLSYPALWVISPCIGYTLMALTFVLQEEYIQGAVEFVGTALKYQLSAPSGPLSGTPPENMLRKINGTVVTTTFGWEYDAAGSVLLLLPITIVAGTSILIVLFATYQNRGIMVAVRHADFDPGDPMFLIAAASAGGMGDTFPGLRKDSVEAGRKKQVKLASIGDRDGFKSFPDCTNTL